MATSSAAMIPVAPGRFSTTIAWPQARVSSWAIARASVSCKPPGGTGTMSRTGFAG